MIEKKKMRTKLEVLLMAIIILCITALSVTSVTRTISNLGDTLETFIRNTNGKYWSASEANLQAAINDCRDDYPGSTVFVGGNQTIQINTGIVLKRYVILNLQGSCLDVRSDVNGVTMGEGSVLEGGTIETRNYAGTYNHAAVCFYPSLTSTGYYGWQAATEVQNMFLLGSLNEGQGIGYQLVNPYNVALCTACSNIYIYQFKYGILINVTAGSSSAIAFANGNMFNEINMVSPEYAIYLNRNTSVSPNYCACDGNQFNNIQVQVGSNTKRIVFADGRYNIFDNIRVWNWSGGGGQNYAFEFPASTEHQWLAYYLVPGTGVQSDNYYISNGTNNYRQDLQNGEYSMHIFTGLSEPDIPVNTMALWHPSGHYYIIQDVNGTQKKVELT